MRRAGHPASAYVDPSKARRDRSTHEAQDQRIAIGQAAMRAQRGARKSSQRGDPNANHAEQARSAARGVELIAQQIAHVGRVTLAEFAREESNEPREERLARRSPHVAKRRDAARTAGDPSRSRRRWSSAPNTRPPSAVNR